MKFMILVKSNPDLAARLDAMSDSPPTPPYKQ